MKEFITATTVTKYSSNTVTDSIMMRINEKKTYDVVCFSSLNTAAYEHHTLLFKDDSHGIDRLKYNTVRLVAESQ